VGIVTAVDLASGAAIWYRRTGSGAPLLHIHGSAFGHRNFERLTPLMAERFEVIDFDLPGYGASRGGPPITDFDGFADEVADLVDRLGYERVHVHGTSFGAMIALTLAARHPRVVDHLVLSCFVARYDEAARMMRRTWKRAAVDSTMDAVADLTSVAGFARSFYDRPDAPAQLDAMRAAFADTLPAAFVAATETIERADLSPLAQLVVAPTLLLAGAEDNMTPHTTAASGIGMSQMEVLMADTRSVVLPDCGHYLVIEAAAAAAELIRRFLAP
jgi:pimeloyl-ACP methyl ester carboxylesterase